MANAAPVRDGSISVRQGEIVVTDPAGGGQPATLAPGNGTRVLVNGKEVTGPTQVLASDRVEVELLDEPGQLEVRVEISPDGLTARAHFEVVPNRRYVLRDVPPCPSLSLVTRVEETVPAADPALIKDALKAQGVFIGIDYSSIDALAADPAGGPRVVARGTPPIPGKDAWIELKFEEMKGPQVSTPLQEVEKVDWRELVHIPTVEEGEELAVKHPLALGKPGVAVTGQTLEPPVPKDVELVCGEGCEVLDGLRAVATLKGRPTAARGKIEVLPILVQEQGVNLASGNIKFNGDVVVKGNVEETMSVQAGGNIEVTGHVTHASLTAGGQIVVRQNLIGGLARAGGVGVVHLKCEKTWEELAQGLEGCTTALMQIAGHPELGPVAAQQGWGRVLHRLLDTKFRSIPACLRDLTAAYGEGDGVLTCEVEKALEQLRARLTGKGALALKGAGELWGLVKLTRNLIGEIKEQCDSNMSFEAYYVHAARVEASGDIIISGRGCYQAYIYAGRTVRVQGQPGVVRGGVIQARNHISVNEAGSAAGAVTLLKVEAGGVIEVGKVYPNVTLQVGEAKYKFDTTDEGVRAHLDDQGLLALH